MPPSSRILLSPPFSSSSKSGSEEDDDVTVLRSNRTTRKERLPSNQYRKDAVEYSSNNPSRQVVGRRPSTTRQKSRGGRQSSLMYTNVRELSSPQSVDSAVEDPLSSVDDNRDNNDGNKTTQNDTKTDSTNTMVPTYGGYGNGMMMYGAGGGNLFSSPMMMMPPPPMIYGTGGAMFSGVYQILYGVQNVIFSLGQVMQLLGTNQQAMQQVFESVTSVMDHAISTFHEVRALEAMKVVTEEQKKRRRRLKAIRWMLVMGTSWMTVKLIRRALSGSRRQRHLPASGPMNPIDRYDSGSVAMYHPYSGNNSVYGVNGGYPSAPGYSYYSGGGYGGRYY